jgi:hypothetical protein
MSDQKEFMRNDLDFEKIVCITLNRTKTKLVAEPESVVVHKRKGERVRWVSCTPGAGTIRIRFKKEDPFLEPTVSGGAQALSGLPRDTALGRHPYTVKLTVGKKTYTLDPDVDIQP